MLTRAQLEQHETIVKEVSIDDVVRFFADAYTFEKDEVVSRKWYVDQSKGKVAIIFETVPKAESAK